MILRILPLVLLAFASAAQTPEFALAGLRVVPDRWDKEANFRKLDHYAREAAARGARLVITPEGFLDGYVGNDQGLDKEKYFAVAEPIGGRMLVRVQHLARELKIYLAIGFSELRGRQVFNTVAIFGPDGQLVSRYSKTHTGSEQWNTPGSEFPVVSTTLGRWGTLICLDRQLPEPARILAIEGAQLILIPSYGGYGEMNDAMMRTRACENGVYVAFVHPKRCLIVDPKGTVVAKDEGGGDQVVLAKIRLDERIGRGPIRARRPAIYGEILHQK
ncbi:MAG: carbon-nitrogen hydrolase family protein [Bryobacterales bacterium]|nr:carbon-nitrogen hydrolase family protein [Bryobacterales bacterium]